MKKIPCTRIVVLSQVYLCRACHKQFVGHEKKVITHMLQLRDGTCSACPHQPSLECRQVLERVNSDKERASVRVGRMGSRTVSNNSAVARTPPITTGMHGGTQRIQDADEALVNWAAAHDIPWSCIDSRNELWCTLIERLKLAGAFFKPCTREVLSCNTPRGDTATLTGGHTARAGGLYLALQTKEHEKQARGLRAFACLPDACVSLRAHLCVCASVTCAVLCTRS